MNFKNDGHHISTNYAEQGKSELGDDHRTQISSQINNTSAVK